VGGLVIRAIPVQNDTRGNLFVTDCKDVAKEKGMEAAPTAIDRPRADLFEARYHLHEFRPW